MNRSFDEGFKYVQYAAKKGSMNGAILLGYCYDAGLGVKQDKKIAEAYYRQGTISNPEFKSYYQQKYGIGRGLFDAAAKAAERMLKTTYSRVFSNTTFQKHQFFGAQLSSQSNSHIHT